MSSRHTTAAGLSVSTEKKWSCHASSMGWHRDSNGFELEEVRADPARWSLVCISIPRHALSRDEKSFELNRESDSDGKAIYEKYDQILHCMLHFIKDQTSHKQGREAILKALQGPKAIVCIEAVCPPGVLYDYTKVAETSSQAANSNNRVPKTDEEIADDIKKGIKPSEKEQNKLIQEKFIAVRLFVYYVDGTVRPARMKDRFGTHITSLYSDHFDDDVIKALESDDHKLAFRMVGNPFGRSLGRFVTSHLISEKKKPVPGKPARPPPPPKKLAVMDPWEKLCEMRDYMGLVQALSVYSMKPVSQDDIHKVLSFGFDDVKNNPWSMLEVLNLPNCIGYNGLYADPRQVDFDDEYVKHDVFGVFPYSAAVWRVTDLWPGDFKTRLFPWLSELKPSASDPTIRIAMNISTNMSRSMMLGRIHDMLELLKEHNPKEIPLEFKGATASELYETYLNEWEPLSLKDKQRLEAEKTHPSHMLFGLAAFVKSLIERIHMSAVEVAKASIPVRLEADESLTFVGLKRKCERLLGEAAQRCEVEFKAEMALRNKTWRSDEKEFEMLSDTERAARIELLRSKGYQTAEQLAADQEKRRRETRMKVRDAQFDDLRKIFNGQGRVSPGFEAVRRWWVDYLARPDVNGNPNRPRKRSLRDGTVFMEAVQNDLLEFETISGCAFVHDLVQMMYFSGLHAYTGETFHPNVLAYGPHAVGKSFAILMIVKLFIEHAVVKVSHMSLRADAATNVDHSDTIWVVEEIPPNWICTGYDDVKVASFKDELTSGEGTSSVLAIDHQTGERRNLIIRAALNRVWLGGTNMPLSDIDPAMADRWVRFHASKFPDEQKLVLEKTIASLKTADFDRMKSKMIENFNWRGVVFAHLCKTIFTGALDPPCLRAAEGFAMDVLRTGARSGFENTWDVRNYMRIRMYIFILVLCDAIDVFYRVCPHHVGEQWDVIHFKEIAPFLTSRVEHAQYIMPLLAFQYEKPTRKMIQNALNLVVTSSFQRNQHFYLEIDGQQRAKQDKNRISIKFKSIGLRLSKTESESNDKVYLAFAQFLCKRVKDQSMSAKEVAAELSALQSVHHRCIDANQIDEKKKDNAEEKKLDAEKYADVPLLVIEKDYPVSVYGQSAPSTDNKEEVGFHVVICNAWLHDEHAQLKPGELMKSIVLKLSQNKSIPEGVTQKRVVGCRTGGVKALWDTIDVKRDETREVRFYEGVKIPPKILDYLARAYDRNDSDDYSPETMNFDIRQIEPARRGNEPMKDGESVDVFYAKQYHEQIGWPESRIQEALADGTLKVHPIESVRQATWEREWKEIEERFDLMSLDEKLDHNDLKAIRGSVPRVSVKELSDSMVAANDARIRYEKSLQTPVKPLQLPAPRSDFSDRKHGVFAHPSAPRALGSSSASAAAAAAAAVLPPGGGGGANKRRSTEAVLSQEPTGNSVDDLANQFKRLRGNVPLSSPAATTPAAAVAAAAVASVMRDIASGGSKPTGATTFEPLYSQLRATGVHAPGLTDQKAPSLGSFSIREALQAGVMSSIMRSSTKPPPPPVSSISMQIDSIQSGASAADAASASGVRRRPTTPLSSHAMDDF